MTEAEALLKKIVERSQRKEKAGSTDIMLQKVPAALIDQARELLGLEK